MTILDKFLLTGKKAVVTGGSRGIGQSIAVAFAEAGADVALLDVGNSAESVEKVKKLGRDCFALTADVGNEKEVNEAFAEVEKRFGTVDILFNNAGICICEPAEEMTYEDWRKVINVNLDAQFLVARAAGRIMIKNGKGGAIISTASMSGYIVNVPQPQVAYNASKAAVIHLTKSLAVEWARFNIRVNSISPGYTATPMGSLVPPERSKNWFVVAPMKRMCLPEELQGAVLYLASDASTYTTGCDIVIDGGYTCV